MPKTTPISSVDSPARRRLPILLRHAWFGLNQAFRRRIVHTGVTPDQFTVLRTLSENSEDGLVQNQLTRLMGSDPNTMASLLERMENAGWLERCPHESDRRAYRIKLKPLGRKKYLQVRKIAIQLQTDLLTNVPEDQREKFLEHLSLVANACQEASQR